MTYLLDFARRMSRCAPRAGSDTMEGSIAHSILIESVEID